MEDTTSRDTQVDPEEVPEDASEQAVETQDSGEVGSQVDLGAEGETDAESEGGERAEEESEEPVSHETRLSIPCELPEAVQPGGSISIMVAVACLDGEPCDLRGYSVSIVDQEDQVLREAELKWFSEVTTRSDELTLTVPSSPGEYTWRAVFGAQVLDNLVHEDSELPFTFAVTAHVTSIAVWDVPDPVEVGSEFTFKAGAVCHSGKCGLASAEFEVYDDQDAKVATGVLGDEVWTDTDALYWGEVTARAPGKVGDFTWRAVFPPSAIEPGHGEAAIEFPVKTSPVPDHYVTVTVVDEDSREPVADARVAIQDVSGGPVYRERTDEAGVARIGVAEGELKVFVVKDYYESNMVTETVNRDIDVELAILHNPPVELNDWGFPKDDWGTPESEDATPQ